MVKIIDLLFDQAAITVIAIVIIDLLLLFNLGKFEGRQIEFIGFIIAGISTLGLFLGLEVIGIKINR